MFDWIADVEMPSDVALGAAQIIAVLALAAIVEIRVVGVPKGDTPRDSMVLIAITGAGSAFMIGWLLIAAAVPGTGLIELFLWGLTILYLTLFALLIVIGALISVVVAGRANDEPEPKVTRLDLFADFIRGRRS